MVNQVLSKVAFSGMQPWKGFDYSQSDKKVAKYCKLFLSFMNDEVMYLVFSLV